MPDEEPPGAFDPPQWPLSFDAAREVWLEEWFATLQDLCPYDPRPLIGGPLGTLHCPVCGCMILAGEPHPRCDPTECWITTPGYDEDLPGVGKTPPVSGMFTESDSRGEHAED